MIVERRFVRTPVELRAKGDETKPKLEGYAAVFNEEYVLYEDSGCRFVETIKPGAFARVLQEKQDVRCLFNHDPNNVLARTTNSTLQLSEDKTGLGFDADLDSRTHIGQDVRCFVDRKDVTGCSFSFTVSKQAWREEESADGKMTTYSREIEEFSGLFDVGPVTFPAYEGTSVGARARQEIMSSMPAEMRSHIKFRDNSEDACQLCGSVKGRRSAGSDCECDCANCTAGDHGDCEQDCKRSTVLSLEHAKARTRNAQISL